LVTAFEQLPAGVRVAPAPSWPLMADTVLSTQAEVFDDKVASLQAALADGPDGRTRGRLRKQLDHAVMSSALAHAKLVAQTSLEVELWDRLWRTPQAALWEASPSYSRMLAQFVRWNVKGEQGDIEAAREARIRGKEFGLTPLTLMGLKAEIERADEAEAKGNRRRRAAADPEPVEGDKPSTDPRAGLYIVDPSEKGGA
jgi:hypothetical protein